MSCILAIDGGGTHTRAGLYTPEGELLAEAEGGPSNPLYSAEEAAAVVVSDLATSLSADTGRKIGRIVAGIAGAGDLSKGEKLANRIALRTKVGNVAVTSDLLMMYYANCDEEAPVIATAGTGSSIALRTTSGRPMIVGGLGPKFDNGSAYQIAIQAIKNSEDDEDLLLLLLDHCGIVRYRDFASWADRQETAEIADIARPVLALASDGNDVALACVRGEAAALAHQVLRSLRKENLCEAANESNLTVLMHGGVFENSAFYREEFMRDLTNEISGLSIKMAPVKAHAAAFQLTVYDETPEGVVVCLDTPSKSILDTEQARSYLRLDEMDNKDVLEHMFSENDSACMSVSGVEQPILQATLRAVESIRSGGRIIYIGAGTSGRLGVLDASECPPTFGVSEDRVVALIAGGDEALRHAIEGAEDDEDQGASDLESLEPPPGKNDIVIGITASGTTPYVLAALKKAKALNAKTAIVCCNPVPLDTADIIIALDTGPEILPGSTRLKAGTATKMVLNQISTGAMAKAGYVFEGLMVGVRPVNAKLRQRCIRIVAELTEKPADESEKLLDTAKGSISVAVIMHRANVDAKAAKEKLDTAGGNLRTALEGP